MTIAQAGNSPPKGAERIDDKGLSDGFSAPPPPPPPPPPPAPMEVPRSVEAFDENIVDGKLKAFVELTKSFASPLVIEQVHDI